MEGKIKKLDIDRGCFDVFEKIRVINIYMHIDMGMDRSVDI